MHSRKNVTRFTTDLSLPHPPTPGLEVVGVDVPKYVQLGADAALHCSYSSTSPVYSVRWYKGGKEFYSFLPGIKVFNQISEDCRISIFLFKISSSACCVDGFFCQAKGLRSLCTGWRGWGWTRPAPISPLFVSPQFQQLPQAAFAVRYVNHPSAIRTQGIKMIFFSFQDS